MEIKKKYRLSVNIAPLQYFLSLKPDLEKFIFEGEEKIKLNIKKNTREITLHARELDIKSAKFADKSKKEYKSVITYQKDLETVTFNFSSELPAGDGELNIEFSGILNDKMRGFYRSTYTARGRKKYIAVTQFEATDARRAFVCADEPSAKAVFNLSLFIPKDLTAISNTPIAKVTEEKNQKKVVFLPTPKMSTYLLAFIVGEFEYLETKTKENVLVRVYTTPGKKHQANFALEVAVKCIEFYEDYFKIYYPLPVLNLVAIPDFASGAMENWGAVTFRESTLLIDPNLSSTANKQWVALVIAHELAHMWFGDLVTMEWWTDLWLNEGFASYIENLAIDAIFPAWDIWTQFVYLEQGTALKLDSLKNTHPIEVAVNNPNEINEIFDKISYSKGASIIRMLAGYLGYKDFRDGLRYYLKKHQYSNAKTNDLWEALEKISKKPVGYIMQNWTQKPGYPLVKIEEQKEKILLSQERFFSSVVSGQNSKDKTIWQIPLLVKNSSKEKPDNFLMSKKTISIPKIEKGWFKINTEESSFVRVLYPNRYLGLIQKAIEKNKMSTVDRLGIIRDVFDLSESGHLATGEALLFAKNYVSETDFTVWSIISSRLNQISHLVTDEPFYREYQKYCLGIFSKIAKRMSWQKKRSEKHTDIMLRTLALYNFGNYGDKETISAAKNLFEKIIKDKKNVDSDIRGVVYSLVAENGKEKEFNILTDLYKKEDLQQEKERICRAIASFREKILVKKSLEFSVSEYVRSQDTARFISAVFANPVGRKLAWEFVKGNWNLFKKKFGDGGIKMISRLIEPMDVFAKEEEAREIEEFFRKNPTPAAQRTITQVLEQIQSNSNWLARDKKGILEFLSKS